MLSHLSYCVTVSLVLSHLSYCVTVWGLFLEIILLQMLQQMQNCAVRLCYGLRKSDHVTGFYHRLRWLPLPYFIHDVATISFISLNVFHLTLQFVVHHIVKGDQYILQILLELAR